MPNVTIPPETQAKVEERDNGRPTEGRPGFPGHILRRDLQRYYDLLASELATVRLTEAEASLICDALNGTDWSLMSARPQTLLFVEIHDACELNQLHEKWGLAKEEAEDLARRLREMSPGQALAIIDAIERFWVHCESSTVESVGLVNG